jgi:hypothetical protein
MQQVWFLVLCLIVSVVYATLGNTDNRLGSMLLQAGRYFVLTVGILLALAWAIYFLSP